MRDHTRKEDGAQHTHGSPSETDAPAGRDEPYPWRLRVFPRSVGHLLVAGSSPLSSLQRRGPSGPTVHRVPKDSRESANGSVATGYFDAASQSEDFR